VPASLPVELNRGRRHEIRVADEFEADGPFRVDLTNHGDDVHVHVGIEGDLAAVARVAETNPYVETDEVVRVTVDVDAVEEAVEGQVTVATGYGSEEAAVDVAIQPFDADPDVPVDEDLATPDPETAPEETFLDDGPSLSRVVVAVAAVVVALSTAVIVGTTPVLVAAGVVVGAAVTLVAISLR